MLVADLEVEGPQIGQVEPLDVVAERPSLGARGPDAIARATHRNVAVERARQDLVDRETDSRRKLARAGRGVGLLGPERAGNAEPRRSRPRRRFAGRLTRLMAHHDRPSHRGSLFFG